MNCDQIRPLIAAYVDDELNGGYRLDVERHLGACAACAGEEFSLRDLGSLLRSAAAVTPLPLDRLRGLAGGIVSRIGAEEQQSWRAKVERLFEDWHWVAAGAGACAAGVATVIVVFALLHSPVSQVRQMNEKVGTLYVMAVPEDGQGAPVMLEYEKSMGMPKGDHRYAVPASFGWKASQALVQALDKSLMRYGATVRFEDLSIEDRAEVESLLNEIARLRQVSPAGRPGVLTNVSGMHLFVAEVVTASGL